MSINLPGSGLALWATQPRRAATAGAHPAQAPRDLGREGPRSSAP